MRIESTKFDSSPCILCPVNEKQIFTRKTNQPPIMESFLKLVATDLYQRTGGDLGRTAVVFPNKRASLFFNEYLAQLSDTPLWSPAYVSISELFRHLSPWQVGDPVKLVCQLYRIFREETKSLETLDDFYFWGEMLISDFDDADKNLVDTDKLFSNLQELRVLMDDYTFLEKEQEEAIRQFFEHFSIEKRTALKERFISLWDALGPIYTRFRQTLAEQNLAYEGMLYRQVVEHLEVDALPYDRYVFVGFNVLNKVEHTLFSRLQEAGKALFYWDYDRFYLNVPEVGHSRGTRAQGEMHGLHEAGEFIRRNLRDFPQSLPPSAFDQLGQPKQVEYIASSTENAQARYLPQWIRQNLTTPEKETAVVLCNEALLQPVLHSLPEQVKHINITMGFPLSQTPVYSFLNALIDLHTYGFQPKTGRYTFQQVVTLLKHPYTRQLSAKAEPLEQELTQNNRFYPLPSDLCRDAFLEKLFTPATHNRALANRLADILQEVAVLYRENTAETGAVAQGQPDSKSRATATAEPRAQTLENDAFNQLYRESLFKAYTTVNRFRTLIEEGELDVQPETFRRLLVKVLTATNIPFHGEPAIGLQVMGVLETRNLDFRHLVLLSVNEGQLPQAAGDSSFIPYNLRKAFGMTTLEHKISVYAYYFYRLLQRAEKVTLLYNTSSEGLNRGEWSRFLLQFLIEWPHPIARHFLETGQSPRGTAPITVPKTPAVMKRLQSLYDLRVNPRARFSPSALNAYLDCPLKFYFKYVAGLSMPDEVSAEIDSAHFGSIFHRAAENIYKDFCSRHPVIEKERIEDLLRNEVKLNDYVDAAFKELFFNVPQDEKPEYNGLQLINAAVIVRYLKQLLQNDLRYAPFTFVGSEQEVAEAIDIQTPKGVIHSRIGGIIDRLDRKDGTLRIVDYKTGGKADTPPNVESLFIPDKKRSNYIFQTFLYAAILCRQEPACRVSPALLYIHQAAKDDYSPVIQLGEPRKAKEAVEDFSRYEPEFRERLQALLEEIFHPDINFNQTEVPEKCTYCDYRKLCRK